MPTRRGGWVDEKGPAGLVDADVLNDLEERLAGDHVTVKEFGAVGDNVADDTIALQEAIEYAITHARKLWLNDGKYKITKGLKAVTDLFVMEGAGSERAEIVPDSSAYDALTIGPGAGGSGTRPSGYVTGFDIGGGSANVKKAGSGPDTGKAAFKLDGMRNFVIGIRVKGNHDIAFDLVNNCYGWELNGARAEFEDCRVALNLRIGTQNGEDGVVHNSWLSGEVCAVHMAKAQKNIKFERGQLTANRTTASPQDDRGVVIVGKDYLTGETGGGVTNIVFDCSFEYFAHCWAVRAFGQCKLTFKNSSSHASSGKPALGFFKGSGLSESRIRLVDHEITGDYSGSAAKKIVTLEGASSAFVWDESGTYGSYKDGGGETKALWDPLFVRAEIGRALGWREGPEVSLGWGLLLREDNGDLQMSNDYGGKWASVARAELWTPEDMGFKAWAFDPAAISGAAAPAANGLLQVVRLKVPVDDEVSAVHIHVGVLGSADLANSFTCVHQGGALLGQSANFTAMVNNTGALGVKTIALLGAPLAVEAGFIDVGFWFGAGTTKPSIGRGSSQGGTPAAGNGLLSGAALRFATANSSLSTTAPATLGAKSGASNAWWVAVS